MQEEIRGVAGLTVWEDSVEDLVLGGGEGGELAVTGVCLGELVQVSLGVLTRSRFCYSLCINA